MNQDAAFTASWGAAVADGVGGGPSGDLASASLLHRLVPGASAVPDAEALVERLREANWDLRAHVERDASLRGMATTFTGVFLGRGSELLVAHSGDSRAYLLRGDSFARQTRDDSYVQALVDRGLLAPEAAQTHPRRNIITASFGGSEDDLPGVAIHEPVPGDRWMICSDGLTDYVPEADVRRILESTPDAADAARACVALALEAATRDNVTVVVCDVVDGEVARDQPVFYGAAADRFNEEFETA